MLMSQDAELFSLFFRSRFAHFALLVREGVQPCDAHAPLLDTPRIPQIDPMRPLFRLRPGSRSRRRERHLRVWPEA